LGIDAYDAEGVGTAENVLVENGKLISLLSSRETAAKFVIVWHQEMPDPRW